MEPRDVFPPAPPANLALVPAPGRVELAWDPGPEPDLRGYRVYRSVDNGPMEAIAALVETPSYSDRTVQSGRRYTYQVSALDEAGNESGRSASVETDVP